MQKGRSLQLSHFRNFLSCFYFLSFPDQQALIVSVGADISIVVFDDDQLTESRQPAAAVNHPAVGACPYVLTQDALYIDTLSNTLLPLKSLNDFAPGRPDPFAGRRQGGLSPGSG